MATKKIPGLDGIRALAVLLVIASHFELLECGWIGVQLFFVLSGFLITGILLREKASTFGLYLRNFYGRRSLRIFPLYYAYLGIITAINCPRPIHSLPHSPHALAYAFTYTYNFYFASQDFSHSVFLTHFWSLAVEEQFYLIWPALIFFLPSKRLKFALIAIIALGPIVRFLTHHYVPEFFPAASADRIVYGMTTSHLDAFAAGALISLSVIRPSRLFLLALLLGTVLAGYMANGAGISPYPPHLNSNFQYVWGYSLLNLTCAVLIACVASGKLLSAFFENKLVSYFGTISYGIYILHSCMTVLVGYFWHPASGLELVLQRCFDLLLCTALAGISYHFYESPIMRMKDKWFPSIRT